MLEKSCGWWFIWYLLFFCHGGAEGQLQWVVKEKVAAYGQNLILFCPVENCCSEPAGWSVGTKSIILDVKTFSNDPKGKHHGTYNKDGFGVVIRNLSEADLNVTYHCVYGFDLSTPKQLLHGDVFKESTEEEMEDLYNTDNQTENEQDVPDKEKENDTTETIIVVPIVVIMVLVGIGIVAYCVYRSRIKKKRQKPPGTKEETENLNPSHIQEQAQQSTIQIEPVSGTSWVGHKRLPPNTSQQDQSAKKKPKKSNNENEGDVSTIPQESDESDNPFPVHTINQGRTNYARLGLVVNICSNILREIMRSNIAPKVLYGLIKKNNLSAFDKMTHKERASVNTLSNRTYDNIDFITLYKLMRSLSLLDDPTQGWEEQPTNADVAISDDVERLRIARKKIVHRRKADIDLIDMNDYFSNIVNITQRIDTYLGKLPDQGFAREVLNCQTHCMDSEMEQNFYQALKDIEDIKEKFSVENLHFFYGKTFSNLIQDVQSKAKSSVRKTISLVLEDINDDKKRMILNKLKTEINSGLVNIEFKQAVSGSLIIYIDILDSNLLSTEHELGHQIYIFLCRVLQLTGFNMKTENEITVVLIKEEDDIEVELSDNWETYDEENSQRSNTVCLNTDKLNTEQEMQSTICLYMTSVRGSNGKLNIEFVSARFEPGIVAPQSSRVEPVSGKSGVGPTTFQQDQSAKKKPMKSNNENEGDVSTILQESHESAPQSARVEPVSGASGVGPTTFQQDQSVKKRPMKSNNENEGDVSTILQEIHESAQQSAQVEPVSGTSGMGPTTFQQDQSAKKKPMKSNNENEGDVSTILQESHESGALSNRKKSLLTDPEGMHAVLGRITVTVLPKMCQQILESFISADNLYCSFQNRNDLKIILVKEELAIITTMVSNGYKHFTVQLCYKILRHEQWVGTPRQNWGNVPLHTDIHISDDIERIRLSRNKIVSMEAKSLDKTTFLTLIDEFREIAKRVDFYLKKEVKFLLQIQPTESMTKAEIESTVEKIRRLLVIEDNPFPVHTINQDRTNYARLGLVVVDIFPNILREIMYSTISPEVLYRLIRKQQQNNPSVFNKMTREERVNLNTLTNKTYDNIDFITLYKLMRSFSLLDEPTQGWGKPPTNAHVTITDDVERLRFVRNKIVHRIKSDIDLIKMRDYLSNIANITQRIDTYLGKLPDQGFEREVLNYQTHCMDSEMKQRYHQALEDIEDIKEKFAVENVHFYYGNTFSDLIKDVKNKAKSSVRETIRLIMEDINDDEKRRILNVLKTEINSGLVNIEFKQAVSG